MGLGLGASLSKTGLATPGIVTDSLVLKHNYAAGGVTPVSDGAAFFDGSDDYIDFGNDSSLQITGALSIAAWVKVTDTDANQRFLTKYDGTDKCFYISVQDSGGVFRFNITSSNSEKEVNGTSNNFDSQWHHVVCVFTPSTSLKMYVDGVLEGTNTSSIPATIDNDDVKLFIGAEEDLELDFTGYICNVGIWSASLTQAQIKSIMWKNYAGLTSTETTNLVSWWNLDEGTGTTANDSHGSNNGSATFT